MVNIWRNLATNRPNASKIRPKVDRSWPILANVDELLPQSFSEMVVTVAKLSSLEVYKVSYFLIVAHRRWFVRCRRRRLVVVLSSRSSSSSSRKCANLVVTVPKKCSKMENEYFFLKNRLRHDRERGIHQTSNSRHILLRYLIDGLYRASGVCLGGGKSSVPLSSRAAAHSSVSARQKHEETANIPLIVFQTSQRRNTVSLD